MTHASTSSAATVGISAPQPTGIVWVLWPLLAALPWLLPTHAEPWTTFYGEWTAAACFAALVIWSCLSTRDRWLVDRWVIALLLAATIPLIQEALGFYVFKGEGVWAALYLLGVATAFSLARQVERRAPHRFADALFASLAIAALASTGLALYQWLGLDELGVMVPGLGANGRPLANVGQPNNLSTLLVWGLLAIWWAHWRERIGGGVACLAAAFLLFGVALTQSRTGWVCVAMLGLAAGVGRRTLLRSSRQLWAVAGLGLLFVACVFALHLLGDLLMRSTAMSLAAQAEPGKRPMIWRLAIDAIGQQPWLGYGWNQGTLGHVAVAERYPNLHVVVGQAHNVVLDLALWNGVPLALLMTTLFAAGLWIRLRKLDSAREALPLLGLCAFLVHALLELPHVYMFMLLPAAAMLGLAVPLRSTGTRASVSRWVPLLLMLLMTGCLYQLFDEYRQIEAETTAERFRAARIGAVSPQKTPDVLLLRPLQQAIEDLRIKPERGMEEQQLQRMRRAITRHPAWPSILRYAQAAAINGRPDEARWAARLLCHLHPVATCKQAGVYWAELAAEGHPELALIAWPPS